MRRESIVVLGAGLAGLSFAYEATRLGHSVTLVEKEAEAGGLLRSEEVNGYVFDTGGSHVIFSKYPERVKFLTRILNGNIVRNRRDARIFYNGTLVKYPFENGLYALPAEKRYKALKDILERYIEYRCGGSRSVENFEEWLYATFGETIASEYLVPYNRKLWKRDLKQISLDWVGNRVPQPPLDDVIRSAVGIPTEGYLHQLFFYYPRSGGIQSLADAFKARVEGSPLSSLVLGKEVVKVDPYEGEVVLSDGSAVRGDRIVSTIPLPELYRALGLRLNLDYNSLVVVGVGVKDARLPRVHWIYFPNEDIVFHRLAILSNYSPYMSPKGSATLVAEITLRPGETFDEEKVVNATLDGLEAAGLLRGRGSVEVVRAWYWRYAYIVYDHNYSRRVREAKERLRRLGISLIGRFGLWEYMNMDDVVYRSISEARKIGRAR